MIERLPKISENNMFGGLWDKINEIIDAVNRLNTREEELPEITPEEFNRIKDELRNPDPISNYKARLKEKILEDKVGDRSLVRAEVYKRVLDLIDEE